MIEYVILGIALAASMMVLIFKRGLLDALIDALNNFRGGPPAAMHPSPANDAVVLLRRRRNPDSTQSAILRNAQAGEKPWMKAFGKLRELSAESSRINRLIAKECRRVEPEDLQ